MTRANRIAMLRHLAACTLAAVFAARAQAQDTPVESKPEEQARLARRSAGVLIGTWSLLDSPAAGTTTASDSPIGVGFFRKGIDKHLAFETTVGVWQRVVETPASGGLGGTAGGKTTAVLLPQFTSIKLFPFTGPDARVEPFVSGGVGFTLGFQSSSGGGGLIGGGGGSGLIVGVGGGGGAGVEWRFSNAFGLTLGGHYTYIQFFDDLAGEKLYRGTGLNAGITYRFQY